MYVYRGWNYLIYRTHVTCLQMHISFFYFFFFISFFTLATNRPTQADTYSMRAQRRLAFSPATPWEWRLMKNSAQFIKEWLKVKAVLFSCYIFFLPVYHFVFLIVILSALVSFVFCISSLFSDHYSSLSVIAAYSSPCMVKKKAVPYLSDKCKWLVILPWLKHCNHWSPGSTTFALRLAWTTNLLLIGTMCPQRLNVFLTRDLEWFEFIWWSGGFVTINGQKQNLSAMKHCRFLKLQNVS